jgi:hypothetical protein
VDALSRKFLRDILLAVLFAVHSYCIAAEEALPSRTPITLMNPISWIDAIRRRAGH